MTSPSPTGTERIPLADLAAARWTRKNRPSKRLERIRRAHRERVELPPILVALDAESGAMKVLDGAHRLTVAHDLGLDAIRVRWVAWKPSPDELARHTSWMRRKPQRDEVARRDTERVERARSLRLDIEHDEGELASGANRNGEQRS